LAAPEPGGRHRIGIIPRAFARQGGSPVSADRLSGLRVLLAEDEMHVQMLIEDFLLELGCEVQAVSSYEAALAAAREAEIDAAVLDVNLNGVQSFPAAEILAARHIPIVFSTGYASQSFPAAWKDRPWLQKPFVAEQLTQALRRALAAPGAGG